MGMIRFFHLNTKTALFFFDVKYLSLPFHEVNRLSTFIGRNTYYIIQTLYEIIEHLQTKFLNFTYGFALSISNCSVVFCVEQLKTILVFNFEKIFSLFFVYNKQI